MATINFDNNQLNIDVLPRVNRTIENLNRLINFNNSISIPYGFAYENFFNEYRNTMRNLRDNYVRQRDFLEQSNKKIESVLNNMDSDLYSIQVVEVKKRNELM